MKRSVKSGIAFAVAAVVALSAVPVGAANAQPRNFCSDMVNKQRADRNGGITQDVGEIEIRYGDPLPLPEGYQETFGRDAAC